MRRSSGGARKCGLREYCNTQSKRGAAVVTRCAGPGRGVGPLLMQTWQGCDGGLGVVSHDNCHVTQCRYMGGMSQATGSGGWAASESASGGGSVSQTTQVPAQQTCIPMPASNSRQNHIISMASHCLANSWCCCRWQRLLPPRQSLPLVSQLLPVLQLVYLPVELFYAGARP